MPSYYQQEMEKANAQLNAMAERYEQARQLFFASLKRMSESLERGDLKEAKSIYDHRIDQELASIPDDITAEQIAVMDGLEVHASIYDTYILQESGRIRDDDDKRLAEKRKMNAELHKIEESREKRLQELRNNNIDVDAVPVVASEYAEKSSQATAGLLPADNWHATDDINVLNEHIQAFGRQIKHFGDRAKGLDNTIKQLETLIKASEADAKKDAAEKKKIEKELAKLAEEEKKLTQAFQAKKERLEDDMKLVNHSFETTFSWMKRDPELRERMSELVGKEDVDAIFSADKILKEAAEGNFDDIKVDKDCPKELADFVVERQEEVKAIKENAADSMNAVNKYTDTRAFKKKFAGFVNGMKAIADEDPRIIAAVDEFEKKHPNEEPMQMDDKLDPKKLIAAAASLEKGKITTIEQLNDLSYLCDYSDSIKKMLDSVHPDLSAPAKKIFDGMKEGFEAIQTIAANKDLFNDISMGLVGGSKLESYKDQIRKKAREVIDTHGKEMIDRAKAVHQNQYASRDVPQNKEMAENKAKQAELQNKLKELAKREEARQVTVNTYNDTKNKKAQWGKDLEALESAKQLAFAKIKQIKASKDVEDITLDIKKQQDEIIKKDTELQEMIDVRKYRVGKLTGFSNALTDVVNNKASMVKAAKAYMEAKENAKSMSEKARVHHENSRKKLMDTCFAKEDQLFKELKATKAWVYDSSEYKAMIRSIDEYQNLRNSEKDISLERYKELSKTYLEKVDAYITAKNGTTRRKEYGQTRMDISLQLKENFKNYTKSIENDHLEEKEIPPVQDPKVKMSLFTEAEVLDKAGVPMYNMEAAQKMKADMEKARENGELQKKANEPAKEAGKVAEAAQKQTEAKDAVKPGEQKGEMQVLS